MQPSMRVEDVTQVGEFFLSVLYTDGLDDEPLEVSAAFSCCCNGQ